MIDGWGGTYMLELIDAGICGVMPGLGVSDLLQLVWQRARAGNKDAAYEIFQGVLPQITYSLQSMEFFHHAEKALLRARGVLANTTVRDATLNLDPIDQRHIEFLNRKVIELARRQRATRCAQGRRCERSVWKGAGRDGTAIARSFVMDVIVDGTGAARFRGRRCASRRANRLSA